MTLLRPKASFGSRRDFQSRAERGLVKRGMKALKVKVAEGRQSFSFTPTLSVVWPKRLPGVLAIDIYEEDQKLVHATVIQGKRKESSFKSQGQEQGDNAQPLVRLLLAREPGGDGKVVFPKLAQPLYDIDKTCWEGAVVDLNVSIYDGESPRGRPQQRLWLNSIPIVKPRYGDGVKDTDHSEGWHWELGARTRFAATNDTSQVPLLENAKYKDRDWDATSHYGLSLTQLPFLKRVTFRMQLGDEQAKELQDRYVLGLHYLRGCEGDQVYQILRPEVLVQVPGREPKLVPSVITPLVASGRSKALKTLQGKRATSPDAIRILDKKKNERWVGDFEVVANTDKVFRNLRGENTAWRGVHAYSYYWLLPQDFRQKGKANIKAIDRAGLVTRLSHSTKDDRQKATFHIPDTWEIYSGDLKEILLHLRLCRAWQQKYEAYYRKHRNEIESYSRIVRPIVESEGFKDIEWPTKGIAGGTVRRKFAAVRTGAPTYEITQLRNMARRMTYHQAKAFRVFTKPRFAEIYHNTVDPQTNKPRDVFLGQNKTFDWGNVTDRFKGMRSTASAKKFIYDDDLKWGLLAGLANNYAFLATKHENRGQDEKARNLRRDRFRQHLGKPLEAMIQSHLAGKDSKEVAYFLSAKISPTKFWASMGGGGFAIFLYGSDSGRDLVARSILGGAKNRWDLLKLKPDEWDRLQAEIKAKHNLDPGNGLEGLELALGYIKTATDWYYMIKNGSGSDTVKSVLDWSDLLLASMELPLKTAKMIKPVWFEVEGVATAAGNTLKFIGKAASVLAVLQSLKGVYDVLDKALKPGRNLDLTALTFALANLAAAVVLFFLPVVGAVLGLLIFFVQGIVALITVGDMEALIYWYCRTPWAKGYYSNIKPLGYATQAQIKDMFEAGLKAFNSFLDEVYEGAKKDARAALRAFFIQWAESNAAYLKIKVKVHENSDRDSLVIKIA